MPANTNLHIRGASVGPGFVELRARARARENPWISRVADCAVDDKPVPNKQHGERA